MVTTTRTPVRDRERRRRIRAEHHVYSMVKWRNARSHRDGLTPVDYTNDAQTAIYKTGSVNVTNAQAE